MPEEANNFPFTIDQEDGTPILQEDGTPILREDATPESREPKLEGQVNA